MTLLDFAATACVASALMTAASLGLTTTIRALIPDTWMFRQPWSCHLCMSTWTSLGLAYCAAFVSWYLGSPWQMTVLLSLVCQLASTGLAWFALTALEHLERLSHAHTGAKSVL